MHVSREEVERLVAEAIQGLPEEFRDRLENVAFAVEDYPPAEYLRKRGCEPDALILGYYQGIPLPKRSVWDPCQMPDLVVIFQGSIERLCKSREEIEKEIRRTVIHEIAHYFGMSDERLRELEC